MSRLPSLAPLLLAGCASVNPITAAKLSMLSPLTTDPGQIQLALDLPPGVGIQPDSAKLTLSAERSDTGASQSQSATLQAQPQDDGLIIYAISPADQPALRARQQAIRDWKDQAPDAVRGSLSVTVTGCKLGAGPAPDARVDVLVRLANDADFRPLISDKPLSQILDDEDLARMRPCDTQKMRAAD